MNGEMIGREDIQLYFIPPSFYSQVAKLTLAEKGVKYQPMPVAPGPPSYETYQPWYMRLNPMGTVPTLVIGETVIADSRDILSYVDREFDGPALFPKDPTLRAEVERWVDEAYQVPERVLAYSTDKLKSMGARTNRGRLRALYKWRAKTPEMGTVYDKKIADIESFLSETDDPEVVAAVWSATRRRLDWANEQLKDQRFCCGEAYTAADILWTITVARQFMLGVDPFEDRPALEAWFLRMKARPSYAEADVWTGFNFMSMLPILLSKLKWHLLGVLTVLTVLIAGLVYLLGD